MKIIIKHLFILLFLGLIPCGCDNDPASPTEEHTDADGFILEDESGNEIYREFQGVLTGSIDLSVGNILKLTVHFINYNGEEINWGEDIRRSVLLRLDSLCFGIVAYILKDRFKKENKKYSQN